MKITNLEEYNLAVENAREISKRINENIINESELVTAHNEYNELLKIINDYDDLDGYFGLGDVEIDTSWTDICECEQEVDLPIIDSIIDKCA